MSKSFSFLYFLRSHFNGKTFATGANVDSDLKLRMLDLEYRFTALNMENIMAGFSLDVIGQLKYIDGEARIFEPTSGVEGKQSIQLPIPMVGVGAHIGLLLNLLEARAKITYATADGQHVLIVDAPRGLVTPPTITAGVPLQGEVTFYYAECYQITPVSGAEKRRLRF